MAPVREEKEETQKAEEMRHLVQSSLQDSKAIPIFSILNCREADFVSHPRALY